jgi:ectoine hydroxylase-related dioxygenase (phytanoyl-CoA dioxygenase family)
MVKAYTQELEQLRSEGFSVINEVYTQLEVENLSRIIEQTEASAQNFRKTKDLFAIRQFLKEVPAAVPLIFNNKLKAIITNLFGDGCFVVKSIYFDKPELSNWFVAYHQDLTISVDKRTDLPGYGPWTVKQNQFAVQPPLNILENNFTIRIHLDDTDEHNGALNVVPGSHLKEIYRPETINWDIEKEVCCPVKQGGIMLMKPLLLHASKRSTNGKRRRVIHIEFSHGDLPQAINWSEQLVYSKTD